MIHYLPTSEVLSSSPNLPSTYHNFSFDFPACDSSVSPVGDDSGYDSFTASPQQPTAAHTLETSHQQASDTLSQLSHFTFQPLDLSSPQGALHTGERPLPLPHFDASLYNSHLRAPCNIPRLSADTQIVQTPTLQHQQAPQKFSPYTFNNATPQESSSAVTSRCTFLSKTPSATPDITDTSKDIFDIIVENSLVSTAHDLIEDQLYDQVIFYLQSQNFPPRLHDVLQKLWLTSVYNSASKKRNNKQLNAVDRYRLRKRFPYPSTIFSGDKTIYLYKESTRVKLCDMFEKDPYPSPARKLCIARECELEVEQVTNWFKNRRGRLQIKGSGRFC